MPDLWCLQVPSLVLYGETGISQDQKCERLACKRGKKRHKQFYTACTSRAGVELLKAWQLNQTFIEEKYFKTKKNKPKKQLLYVISKTKAWINIQNPESHWDRSVKWKQFGLTLLVEQYHAQEAQGLLYFQVKIISVTGVAPVTCSTNTCLQTTTIRKWKCLSISQQHLHPHVVAAMYHCSKHQLGILTIFWSF